MSTSHHDIERALYIMNIVGSVVGCAASATLCYLIKALNLRNDFNVLLWWMAVAEFAAYTQFYAQDVVLDFPNSKPAKVISNVSYLIFTNALLVSYMISACMSFMLFRIIVYRKVFRIEEWKYWILVGTCSPSFISLVVSLIYLFTEKTDENAFSAWIVAQYFFWMPVCLNIVLYIVCQVYVSKIFANANWNRTDDNNYNDNTNTNNNNNNNNINNSNSNNGSKTWSPSSTRIEGQTSTTATSNPLATSQNSRNIDAKEYTIINAMRSYKWYPILQVIARLPLSYYLVFRTKNFRKDAESFDDIYTDGTDELGTKVYLLAEICLLVASVGYVFVFVSMNPKSKAKLYKLVTLGWYEENKVNTTDRDSNRSPQTVILKNKQISKQQKADVEMTNSTSSEKFNTVSMGGQSKISRETIDVTEAHADSLSDDGGYPVLYHNNSGNSFSSNSGNGIGINRNNLLHLNHASFSSGYSDSGSGVRGGGNIDSSIIDIYQHDCNANSGQDDRLSLNDKIESLWQEGSEMSEIDNFNDIKTTETIDKRNARLSMNKIFATGSGNRSSLSINRRGDAVTLVGSRSFSSKRRSGIGIIADTSDNDNSLITGSAPRANSATQEEANVKKSNIDATINPMNNK